LITSVYMYLKGYTARRLTDGFPENSWTKHGVSKLLKMLRDTGTSVDRSLAVEDLAVQPTFYRRK